MKKQQTKCPFCQGVFEITDTHLSARNGFVRCGKCFEIFKADEYLQTSHTDKPQSLFTSSTPLLEEPAVKSNFQTHLDTIAPSNLVVEIPNDTILQVSPTKQMRTTIPDDAIAAFNFSPTSSSQTAVESITANHQLEQTTEAHHTQSVMGVAISHQPHQIEKNTVRQPQPLSLTTAASQADESVVRSPSDVALDALAFDHFIQQTTNNTINSVASNTTEITTVAASSATTLKPTTALELSLQDYTSIPQIVTKTTAPDFNVDVSHLSLIEPEQTEPQATTSSSATQLNNPNSFLDSTDQVQGTHNIQIIAPPIDHSLTSTPVSLPSNSHSLDTDTIHHKSTAFDKTLPFNSNYTVVEDALDPAAFLAEKSHMSQNTMVENIIPQPSLDTKTSIDNSLMEEALSIPVPSALTNVFPALSDAQLTASMQILTSPPPQNSHTIALNPNHSITTDQPAHQLNSKPTPKTHAAFTTPLAEQFSQPQLGVITSKPTQMNAAFDHFFTNTESIHNQPSSNEDPLNLENSIYAEDHKPPLETNNSVYAQPTPSLAALPISNDMTDAFKRREASRTLMALNEFHISSEDAEVLDSDQNNSVTNNDWLNDLLDHADDSTSVTQRDIPIHTPTSMSDAQRVTSVLDKINFNNSENTKNADLFDYLRNTVANGARTTAILPIAPTLLNPTIEDDEGQLSLKAKQMLDRHTLSSARNPIIKRAATNIINMVVWGALCLSLLVTLYIQYLYFNSATTTPSTTSSTLLQLSCRIGLCPNRTLPQDIQNLNLSKVVAVPAASNKNFTTVTARIVNNANQAVTLPNLSFRSMRNGQTIAGRIVLPKEYLDPQYLNLKQLLPNTPMLIQFSLNIKRSDIDKFALDMVY